MDTFDRTVVIGLVISASAFVFCMANIVSAGRVDTAIHGLRLEASAAGLGEFYVNPATGETEFRFIPIEQQRGTP